MLGHNRSRFLLPSLIVLQHIMENLYDAMPYLFDDMSVGSFFSGIGAFEKALTRLDEKKSENNMHGSSATDCKGWTI